ncbi:ABC transporter substrate-binding protein [Ruoffia tabacinasalis]|uniref:ABC transporter substrate-binding protein n=1 Tax=Ruoffia tabacinasalis TaxID=87458 RepID=UPI0030CF3EA5
MKKLQKFILTMVALALVIVSSTTTKEVFAQEDSLDVAVVQLVTHSSLDDIRQGVYDGLAEHGYTEGENLTINYQNAEGDLNILSTIAQSVVAEEPDMIFAITTPVAQAFQNVTSDIPIIMTGVTDPVSAGIVDDLENPGENITGASDAVPYEDQFELLLQLKPDVQKVGMIYTTSEDNSLAETEQAAAVAEEMGIEVQIEGIASTMDMQLVAQTLASEVDAIYVGSDNTIASAFETLLDATDAAGIPVFTTVDVMVGQGALSAVAINQKDIGLLAADVAKEIIDGANPGETPVQFLEELQPVINFETADRLGIEVPEELASEVMDIKDRLGEE